MGSPSAPDPVVCFSQPHGESFGSLLALPTRAICGLSRKFCLMMIYSKEQGRKPTARRQVRMDVQDALHKVLRTPFIFCSLLLRCSEHAQYRHPVVGHLELGLRRQHIEAEKQTERTSYQLYSVFTTSPGKQLRKIQITKRKEENTSLSFMLDKSTLRIIQ